MSAPTSSNRVHSYLIWSSQSKSNKFQEYLFGSDIRLVKSSANRLDAVYSLDKDKPTLFLQVFKPLLQSAFMGYDSSIILSGLEDTIMSLLLKGPENVVFNSIDYLLSEIRQKSEERMLFIACFEATGTTFVDYVGNYLGDNVQYSYSVSKTSISLLRIQETERDMGLVRKIVSEEGRNQNYHRVLQVLITSSESNEFFLSGMSFILFSNCASMVQRLGQLSSLKLEPCSEPSRVLFYPLSVQSVNALVAELVCSVFEGSRLGAMLVLASLEELSRHEIESLVSFATSLRRIRSNPTPCLRKLCVSKNGENRKPVSHPTLANLDNRLNDSQLEIDQAKQHFGVSRTRRTTPSSATWRSFLKSLKILPPGETFSNPTSPALSPSQTDECISASRNQYSENASEDGHDLRYIHLTSRESAFRKCFKCCLPKAVFKEFRSIFDVSESP